MLNKLLNILITEIKSKICVNRFKQSFLFTFILDSLDINISSDASSEVKYNFFFY